MGLKRTSSSALMSHASFTMQCLLYEAKTNKIRIRSKIDDVLNTSRASQLQFMARLEFPLL